MGNKPLSQITDQYFATIEDPDELASEMQNKIRVWRNWCASRGLMSLWSRKLLNYYGSSSGGNSSQQIVAGGSEGELALQKVNDLHSLVQEQLTVVTSQRPAGQARAINSNTQAMKSSRIGTAIAEYFLAHEGFEGKFITCAETALLCDEGWVDLFWQKDAGDAVAVDPERKAPIMSGNAILRTHSPWNVARDPGASVTEQKWHILSYPVCKWDAVASYPDFEVEILGCGDSEDNLPSTPLNKIPDGSDQIWCHLLVHDRTPGCPAGRYSMLIGDTIVFDSLSPDGPSLPYADYPVERMSPSDVIDGPTGYAPCNDIMGIEQTTDALYSIITTNEITFGGQNIVGPPGLNIKVSDIAKGVRFFELAPDLIPLLKPLELLRTPKEVFEYVGMLSAKKERALGSVASALAQQAAQGASGSSMALVQTQALSFNSGTQKSYFRLLSSTMTKLIGMLRTYADTPRVAAIVGKSKSAGLKEFKYTGKDLGSVSAVVYELQNPMSQTYGGRLTMAQDLLKAGQCKSPKQYINLVATGQLDTLTQDDEADGMLILEENEALTEGRPVSAVITEMHADHIKSHNSLITQDAKEKDPEFVGRVLDHVQHHVSLWLQASMSNPGILLATGQQPLMPPPGMMVPPPGAPGSDPHAPQGKPQNPGLGPSPAAEKADGVRQPGLPTIAGSHGEKPTIPGVQM